MKNIVKYKKIIGDALGCDTVHTRKKSSFSQQMLEQVTIKQHDVIRKTIGVQTKPIMNRTYNLQFSSNNYY
jgi:hypothetical protein